MCCEQCCTANNDYRFVIRSNSCRGVVDDFVRKFPCASLLGGAFAVELKTVPWLKISPPESWPFSKKMSWVMNQAMMDSFDSLCSQPNWDYERLLKNKKLETATFTANKYTLAQSLSKELSDSEE